MPLLIVVSQSGLLALLNIINLNKQAPQLCTPPQQLTLPAAALTTDIPGVAQAPAQTAQPQLVIPQPVAPSAPKVTDREKTEFIILRRTILSILI